MTSEKKLAFVLGFIGIGLLSSPVLIAHHYQRRVNMERHVTAAESPTDREGAASPVKTVSIRIKRGEVAFNRNCAMCHQIGGIGRLGIAPSLRNPDFLALASDEFIRQTIRTGREQTAMIPRPGLPREDVENIIAYLRSVQEDGARLVALDRNRKLAGNPDAGETRYASYCAPCHGPDGRGYAGGNEAPGIGLPGFLRTASDDYILHTAMRGRVGTAMRPMVGHRGLANLDTAGVADIIAFLRRQNRARQRELANQP